MTLLLRGGEAGMTHGIIDGGEILTVNQYGGRKGSPQIVRVHFAILAWPCAQAEFGTPPGR